MTFEEFKDNLLTQGAKPKESNTDKFIEAFSIDQNKKVDFNQNISTTLHVNRFEMEVFFFAT